MSKRYLFSFTTVLVLCLRTAHAGWEQAPPGFTLKQLENGAVLISKHAIQFAENSTEALSAFASESEPLRRVYCKGKSSEAGKQAFEIPAKTNFEILAIEMTRFELKLGLKYPSQVGSSLRSTLRLECKISQSKKIMAPNWCSHSECLLDPSQRKNCPWRTIGLEFYLSESPSDLVAPAFSDLTAPFWVWIWRETKK